MPPHMKGREFITLLGGAAAWPLAALAQPGQTSQPPPNTVSVEQADTSAPFEKVARFVRGLRQIEGSSPPKSS
jgi:hypothetical protein